MSTELELAVIENKQVTPVDNSVVTPMTMLSAARQQGASLEQMQQLMDMQFKWEANEARKAYFAAVANFKAMPINITKDKVNKQYNSRYTGVGNLVNTVNAELSKFGLSANWDIKQNGHIEVTCILSHAQGHSERVSLSAEADKSGAKNPIQQVKSTITYLKIATYEAVTGVASSDDPGDNDGNGAGSKIKLVDENQAANLQALIDEVGESGKASLLEWAKIEKIEELPANKYNQAVKALEKRRKA